MSFVVLDTDVASGSLRGRLDDPLRARLTGMLRDCQVTPPPRITALDPA